MQNDPESIPQEPGAEQEMRHQKAELKDTLHACGDKLKDAIEFRARDMGESALHTVASSINAYGSAFRKATEALEEQHEDNAANLTRQVSQSLEETASSIENASPEEAIEYASEQVRVRPLLALGCAFTLGLALSRLLAVEQPEEQDRPKYSA